MAKRKIRFERDVFIRKSNGEEIDAVVEIQETNKHQGFEMVWLGTLLSTLDIIGNKPLKVATYLIRKRNRLDNTVIATAKEIAYQLNISELTVKKTLKMLREAGFIVMIRRGVYRINPNVVWRGYKDKKEAIVILFQNERLKDTERLKDYEVAENEKVDVNP